MKPAANTINDLVCFGYIRWHGVWQRPHHLLSRFAKTFRVYFVEEPVFQSRADGLEISRPTKNIVVVTPSVAGEHASPGVDFRVNEQLVRFFQDENISDYLFWYYTPHALRYTRDFSPRFTVYDCVNLLSTLATASSDSKSLEAELMQKADVVFAGGPSLYELKKKQHRRTYLFPGSVDKAHFAKARAVLADPPDQDSIPHPRFGYFGVVDERFDMQLLENVARLRPNWNFVIVGPVERLDPLALPGFNNIHFLGRKPYEELPQYLSGWEVALVPFAHLESTRYLSPVKTAEYLAGGKPVIATPIIDVIRLFGNKGVARIAGTPEEFVKVGDAILQDSNRAEWLEKVDELVSHMSWDNTYNEMLQIIRTTLVGKPAEKVSQEKDREFF